MTTIVVLGMHRSGTSCVTRALHEGGMYLGDRLMNETATDNLEGHWESWDVVQINEEILKASGASWHEIPPEMKLVAPEGIEKRITDFLGQLAAQSVFGFKDPRTLLTLPLWKPHLSDVRYVACLRHPYNVARSLSQRFAHWKWEKGLNLWLEYNSRLLRYAEEAAAGTLYWFDFDAEPAAVNASIVHMLDRLGLRRTSERFNPFLRHHEELPAIAEAPLAELYQALRQRVAEQAAQWPVNAAASPNEPPAAEERVDLGLHLRQLRGVNTRQDELIQRQQATIWSLDARLQEVQARLDKLQVRWGALMDYQELSEAELGATWEEVLEYQTLQWRTERHTMETRIAEAVKAIDQAGQARHDQLQHQIQLDRQHQLEHLAALGAQIHHLHHRTALLEQRLFWPMVVRTARRFFNRLRRIGRPPVREQAAKSPPPPHHMPSPTKAPGPATAAVETTD